MIMKKEIPPALDAPVGYIRTVYTPWGTFEDCRIVEMVGLDSSTEYYASVNKPTTNFNVRWSVFRTYKENMVDNHRKS